MLALGMGINIFNSGSYKGVSHFSHAADPSKSFAFERIVADLLDNWTSANSLDRLYNASLHIGAEVEICNEKEHLGRISGVKEHGLLVTFSGSSRERVFGDEYSLLINEVPMRLQKKSTMNS